jgi:uncharacterized protein YdaL
MWDRLAIVLYDAPAGTEWEKLGFAYAIMLRNLLGHFDAQVDLVPVQQYTAGKVNGYDATFYLGAAYDNRCRRPSWPTPRPPPSRWSGSSTTSGSWPGTRRTTSPPPKGISFNGLRGMNAVPSAANPNPGFFDTVKYKGLDFVKYYAYDGAATSSTPTRTSA